MKRNESKLRQIEANWARLEPKNAEWHAQLAALRDGREAENDLSTALQLDPCNVRALEQKAMLLERLGQPLQAIELLEKVARENRHSKERDVRWHDKDLVRAVLVPKKGGTCLFWMDLTSF